MNRFRILTSIALAALLATPVVGESQSPKRTASAEPMLADSAMTRAKAGAAASVSFASMMTAMGSLPDLSTRVVRIRGLRPEHITLVDVRNLFRYTDDQKNFEKALAQHERQITAMRSTLQGSLVLRDLLYERQLTMSQVVAVDTSADGRTTVFYLPE